MIDINTPSTLKNIRAAYTGLHLDKDALAASDIAGLPSDRGEVTMSWESLDRWSGSATLYEAVIKVDSDLAICKIEPLQCQRLVGDDAQRSTYRTGRAGESDYFCLDLQLFDLLDDRDKPKED